MINQRLFNLNRIDYTTCRDNINGLCLDRNEKPDIWERKHFDKIYNNIRDYEFCYYPDDSFDFLYKKISTHYNVKYNNFIDGLGADYLIRDFLIMYNDQVTQKNILVMDLNYGMYEVFCRGLNYNCTLFDYNLDINSIEKYSTNKEKLFKQISENDIIVITLPNQISNYDFTFEDIDHVCNKYKNKTFLIDEVYYGYGSFTTLDLIKKHKNIFILRSFSKEFGLASLRFGLLFGHEESMKYFKNISSVYNTNIFTAKTVEYFLDNYHLIEDYKKQLIEGREFLKNELTKKGYNVFSTNTMSIFIFLDNEKETNELYEKLYKKKVYTKKYLKINAIRITCGSKNTMKKTLEKFDINYNKFYEIYKKDGYVLIEDLFDSNEIFEINNLFNLNKYKDCYEKNIYNGKILRLEKFVKSNKNIVNLIENKLNLLLEKILGSEYQIFKDKIIEKYPNFINNFNLHMDGIFKTYNYRLKKETFGWWTYSDIFTNVNIMLTDNTIENGALSVAKNKYEQNLDNFNYIIDNNIVDKKSGFIIKDVEEIKRECNFICAKKGSVLIFNPLCPHFSNNNISQSIRRNIYLTFCSKTTENIYKLFNEDKDLIIKNIGKDKFENEMLNEPHLRNN